MTSRERLIASYVKLVREGRLTLEQVFVGVRSDVEKALNE